MVLLDLQHHTIFNGRSGAGKTYGFRKTIWRQAKERIVFINTQREADFGREVRQWDRQMLAKPGSRLNIVGPRPSTEQADRDKANALLARVVNDVIEIGESTVHDRKTAVLVAVDEAHLFEPKGTSPTDPGPLGILATNGARYGVRFVAITQRPALLSHTVLSQANVHVLYDLDLYEDEYLDRYSVPDDVRHWIRDPLPGADPGDANHRFAVRQGTVWSKCKPV